MKSRLRGVIVVIAICSWLAISNHCVFAALATNNTPSSECPFHSKPKKKPANGGECCKTLRAVASVPAKTWVRDDTRLSDADAYCSEHSVRIVYSQSALVPLCLDTGPPGARSFAELILQQSLFAHAPPTRV